MKALGNLSLRRRTLLCLGFSLAVVVVGELALVALAGGAGLIDVQVSRGLWLLGSGSAAEAAIVAALSASGAVLAVAAAYMTGGRPLQVAYRAALDGSREQAHTDDLTGLPNRRSLQVALARTLQGAKESDGAAALLFLDLDGFKDLNDSMGHAAGDLLLELVGARLRPLLRDGDVLARIGGDEFALVLPGAGENGALEIVGRVQQGLATAFPVRDVAIHVEASIGVALYPLHGDDAEALAQRADVAMYHAKRARTGFELYSLERDEADQGRLGLLGEMRRAIAGGELRLHYQPKIDLRSGNAVGVEALVRWRHPERGLLQPGEFLPMAEQTGLMRALTSWVLDTALAQCRLWSEAGHDLPVAVNLSLPNVLDTGLPAEVAGLLERWDVPADRLCLEITENVVLGEAGRVGSVLVQLKQLGVQLSLDDFGTGQASLAHLKDLPLDELKIDRSFVMQMDSDERDAAIVRTTADLGRRLGLRVVAEGLESAAAWRELARFGCEVAQGFHVTRPLPPDELSLWLERWKGRNGGPGAGARLTYRGGSLALPVGVAPEPVPAEGKGGRSRLTYRGATLGGEGLGDAQPAA